MSTDGNPFDDALAGLVVVAAFVLLGACVFGADWVRPPGEGAGPFVTPERAHAFRVVAVGAAGVCLVCVVRAFWGDTSLLLGVAGLAIAVVVVFGVMLLLPSPRVELRADGFSSPTAQGSAWQSAVFYNTTDTDLVVCLGAGGICDAAASGPARLRSPGLVVPAGRRVGVDMPVHPDEFRVTLISPRPGIERRDLVLTSRRPQVL